MTVIGELVEAQVGHQYGVVAQFGGQRAERHIEHAVRVVRAGAPRILAPRGTPKIISPPTPASTASTAALTRDSQQCWTTPGIDAIGVASAMPSRTNMGSTRSAAEPRSR